MAEWNHESVWGAIDALAARHRLSPSGLAKKSGLDATAFNPSKRHGPDPTSGRAGRRRSRSPRCSPRRENRSRLSSGWRSGKEAERGRASIEIGRHDCGDILRSVPLLGFAQAGVGGFFDDGGFPPGQGWDEIALPGLADEFRLCA